MLFFENLQTKLRSHFLNSINDFLINIEFHLTLNDYGFNHFIASCN